jgi:hypothetical protein
MQFLLQRCIAKGVDSRKVWINSICWTIYQQRIATGDLITRFALFGKNTTKTFPHFLAFRPGVAFPLHFRVRLIPLSSSTGEVGPFDPPVFLRYRGDPTMLMLCCVIKTSKGAG